MVIRMKNENEEMCPLFPDLPCPRGKDSADDCQVRMESGYDPLIDFKDYLFMNCAIQRANEREKRISEKIENRT